MRIFLAVIVCMITSTLNSAVITQTQVFSGTPNFVNTLTFNKFNGPGNLTDIVLTFEATGELGKYFVDNDSITPGVFQTEFGVNVGVTSPDVAFLDNSFSTVIGQLTVSNSNVVFLEGNDGDGPNFDAGGPDFISYESISETISTVGNVGDFLFFQYTGPGTFDVNVSTSQYLDFGGVGGLRGAFSPSTVNGVFTVEYYSDHAVTDYPIFWVFFVGLIMICVVGSMNRKEKVGYEKD